MKRFRRALFILALVLLAFTAGHLYPTLRRPPLVLGQDAAVAGVAAEQVAVSYRPDAGGFIDIAPRGDYRTVFIFYPGGLVRPQAYEWLGVALTPYGVRTAGSPSDEHLPQPAFRGFAEDPLARALEPN